MSALRKWIDGRRPAPKAPGYGPIGVHFTQEHVHLVQLETLDGGEIAVRSRESQAYPGTRAELLQSPAAVRKLIRRAMRSGNFRGRHVVSAMPPEQVRTMSISYPANSRRSEAGNIARLMVDRVDGELSDYVVDYVPIRMSACDGERLALVAVSRLEHVTNYLDCLASAGLHVDFLEIGPLAIKRLIEFRTAPDQQENVIVLHVGATTTHLTTISGRRLLADQEVQFGEEVILNAVAKSLDVTLSVANDLVLTHGIDPGRQKSATIDTNSDPGVAATLIEIVKPEFLKLVREIERAFLFADSESQGRGSRRIYLAGGGARWPGTASLLASLARMQVEQVGHDHMPFAGHATSIESISDEQAAQLSTAVGLALRGMTANE